MSEQVIKPGKTAKKLDIVIDKWCNLCASSLTKEILLRKLDSVVPELKELLIDALQQGQQYMATELKRTTGAMIEQEHLIEKMNQLDELIQMAKQRQPVSQRLAPTPQQIMRGVSWREKQKESNQLIAEYEKIRRENDEMMIRLAAAKNKLSSKRTKITDDVEKFKKASNVIRSINQNELVNIMSKMDLIPERT
ncbi:hypothetical protein BD770DRAFT_399517 [Pilaira anomala]|nr:hypothetical protein BD770DRAFT_399517 [Pilaira anomala]